MVWVERKRDPLFMRVDFVQFKIREITHINVVKYKQIGKYVKNETVKVLTYKENVKKLLLKKFIIKKIIIVYILHQQVPLPVPCVNFTQITFLGSK